MASRAFREKCSLFGLVREPHRQLPCPSPVLSSQHFQENRPPLSFPENTGHAPTLGLCPHCAISSEHSLSPHEALPSYEACTPTSSKTPPDVRGSRHALSVMPHLIRALVTVCRSSESWQSGHPPAPSTFCPSLCPPTLLGPVPGTPTGLGDCPEHPQRFHSSMWILPVSRACLPPRSVLSSEQSSRGGTGGPWPTHPKGTLAMPRLAHSADSPLPGNLPLNRLCLPLTRSRTITLHFPANSIFPKGDFSSTCLGTHKTRSKMEQALGEQPRGPVGAERRSWTPLS